MSGSDGKPQNLCACVCVPPIDTVNPTEVVSHPSFIKITRVILIDEKTKMKIKKEETATNSNTGVEML